MDYSTTYHSIDISHLMFNIDETGKSTKPALSPRRDRIRWLKPWKLWFRFFSIQNKSLLLNVPKEGNLFDTWQLTHYAKFQIRTGRRGRSNCAEKLMPLEYVKKNQDLLNLKNVTEGTTRARELKMWQMQIGTGF